MNRAWAAEREGFCGTARAVVLRSNESQRKGGSASMGLTFTKLFQRLWHKREMRILMVRPRRRRSSRYPGWDLARGFRSSRRERGGPATADPSRLLERTVATVRQPQRELWRPTAARRAFSALVVDLVDRARVRAGGSETCVTTSIGKVSRRRWCCHRPQQRALPTPGPRNAHQGVPSACGCATRAAIPGDGCTRNVMRYPGVGRPRRGCATHRSNPCTGASGSAPAATRRGAWVGLVCAVDVHRLTYRPSVVRHVRASASGDQGAAIVSDRTAARSQGGGGGR